MFFRCTDIPFATDDTQRFLPWLTGVMVGLAAFFLCVGLSLNDWVIGKNISYSGSFTVNIPASDTQKERTEKIIHALKKIPGVKKVEPIDDAQLKEMLAPWIGDHSFDGLPLPTVLNVTLANPQIVINYDETQKSLSYIAPGVEIDAHERWSQSFSHFSNALQHLTNGLALLVIAALAITIAFTSRASLKLHNQAVHLLHSIGADDQYIVRQFQQEAVRVVLPGALAGCLVSALLYWGISVYMASLNMTLLPPMPIAFSHVILLTAMVPICVIAAWMVAHFSIAMQLKRIL